MSETQEKQNIDLNPPHHPQPDDGFLEHLDKYTEWLSTARFYPDLLIDAITPEKGGIKLGLDQRVFLRVLCRQLSVYGVYPRGYGKCVKGDTLILTNDGVKEIQNLFNVEENGDEAYSLYDDLKIQNRYGELEKVSAGVYSGYKDTLVINTEEGFEIEPSLNHPLLIMSNDGQLDWKRTEELKIGDYLVLSRADNVWGSKTTLDVDMDSWIKSLNNRTDYKIKKYNAPTELTEELALIMGYLIGDGCLTRDDLILFTTKDEDILERYTQFMTGIIGVEVKQRKTGIDYVSHGRFVREYFRQIGLDKVDAFGKTVPKCIMEAPKTIVVSFLKGLFDTDGTVTKNYVSFCSSSEKMSKEVQTLLLNLGIVSTRRKKFNKKFETFAYIIDITGADKDIFKKEIGFSCKRKQLILENVCNGEITRNTNKDVIPFQKDLVCSACEKLKTNDSDLKNKFYHVRKGNCQLTYNRLEYLLSVDGVDKIPEYSELSKLQSSNYFYSKIKMLKPSKAHVYDLSVPETNSFISNGFVSHNTFIEILGLILTAIMYPKVNLSLLAQSKDAAAGLLSDKVQEICQFYPMIEDCIKVIKKSNSDYEIIFKNGSRITNLASAQTSKGKRRHSKRIFQMKKYLAASIQ